MKMCRELAFAIVVCLAASVSADGSGHGHHHAHAPAPAPAPHHAPEPVQGYSDSPPVSYGAPAGFDMTMLIIPFIALIGLFLLFPTYITLDTVRRKREVGDEPQDGVMNTVMDKIQDIYYSVVESEECLERIACQVGSIARSAGLDRSVSTGAMLLAPPKFKKYAKKFAMPADCDKIKCHAY